MTFSWNFFWWTHHKKFDIILIDQKVHSISTFSFVKRSSEKSTSEVLCLLRRGRQAKAHHNSTDLLSERERHVIARPSRGRQKSRHLSHPFFAIDTPFSLPLLLRKRDQTINKPKFTRFMIRFRMTSWEVEEKVALFLAIFPTDWTDCRSLTTEW